MKSTKPLKIRALMIEDNPADVRLVLECVNEGDNSVELVHCERLDAGLKLLSEEEFDAILLDLNLPDSRGAETLQAVRGASPNTAVIVFSGNDEGDIGLETMGEGAQDFLSKNDFDSRNFVQRVHYAIERAALFSREKKRAPYTPNPNVEHEIAELVMVLKASNQETEIPADTLSGMADLLAVGKDARDLEALVFHLASITREVNTMNIGTQRQLQTAHKTINEITGQLRAMVAIAGKDDLTGLINRRGFNRRLAKELKNALKTGEPLCLVVIDIEDFKMFTAKWDHETGEAVLKFVGQCILETFSKIGIAARHFGEEFAVILPNTPAEKALEHAKGIRSTISERVVTSSSKEAVLGQISLSTGVALARKEQTAGALLADARLALQEARNIGRNQVSLAC